MVLPNIGAILAWGLITALFIPTGWLPNAKLAQSILTNRYSKRAAGHLNLHGTERTR